MLAQVRGWSWDAALQSPWLFACEMAGPEPRCPLGQLVLTWGKGMHVPLPQGGSRKLQQIWRSPAFPFHCKLGVCPHSQSIICIRGAPSTGQQCPGGKNLLSSASRSSKVQLKQGIPFPPKSNISLLALLHPRKDLLAS